MHLNPKSTILYAGNGIDFCGYIHHPEYRKVRKASVRRLKNDVKHLEAGELDREAFERKYKSRLGHMGHADTYHVEIDAITLLMIKTSLFSRIFSFSSVSFCCFLIFSSMSQKQKPVTALGILIARISVCKSISLPSINSFIRIIPPMAFKF